MQISTEVKTQVDEIKELDKMANIQAASAKEKMQEALNCAIEAGQKLESIRLNNGTKRYEIILESFFEKNFVDRSKRYRKIFKKQEDPRQCLLSLGIFPENQNENKANKLKLERNLIIRRINDLFGIINKNENLGKDQIIAFKQLYNRIGILLSESNHNSNKNHV